MLEKEKEHSDCLEREVREKVESMEILSGCVKGLEGQFNTLVGLFGASNNNIKKNLSVANKLLDRHCNNLHFNQVRFQTLEKHMDKLEANNILLKAQLELMSDKLCCCGQEGSPVMKAGVQVEDEELEYESDSSYHVASQENASPIPVPTDQSCCGLANKENQPPATGTLVPIEEDEIVFADSRRIMEEMLLANTVSGARAKHCLPREFESDWTWAHCQCVGPLANNLRQLGSECHRQRNTRCLQQLG